MEIRIEVVENPNIRYPIRTYDGQKHGAIFTEEDKLAKTAFRYALSKHNDIKTNPFALAAYIDEIDVSDSFTLASAICDRMADGVFLFFGVKNMTSLDIVQSFTKTFHMPYLSPSTSMWTPKSEFGYEVHLKPDFSYAIMDMILYFEWPKVHYVYDSDEGLQHMQLVLSQLREVMEAGHPFNVKLVARRLYNVTHAHDELRQLDKVESDQDKHKFIVFDLSSEKAYRHILRQIPEVGMNKDGYHYLIATLDFANMDMRRYLHGGVNITGFQLIDLESKVLANFIKEWNNIDHSSLPDSRNSLSDTTLTYEAALAVDAIAVIERALKGMVTENSKIFQSTFRRKEVYNNNRTKGIPCTTHPPIPWMHGAAIMEQIKRLDFEGLTGRINFDSEGYRRDYKLDVYTVGLDTGPTKIGSWSPYGQFGSLYDVPDNTPYDLNGERPIIITSIESAPFLMIKKPDKNGKPLLGNDRFEGYVKDLAEKISEKYKFEYEIRLVNDSRYGAFVKKNGTWDGMIGELIRHEADICIAPLTITYDREKVVDFSKPFMNFGISIMIKKPEIMKPGVFSFMEPLEAKIWICVVFAYSSVSVGLFLVGRFSPFEWNSSNSGPIGDHFGILNSLWFAMGALMLQGSDSCPRSFSGRVIGTVWWFFVLIIISSYTANLAAFLTIERMHVPIESADDLSMQTDIKYGILGSGSTREFFKNSKVPVYERMWNYMSANPSVFVKSNVEGIERVKKSKGKYAYLLESPLNEYENSKEPCDTMKVGPNLNSKGYGIATRKYSPLSDQMNLAVLMLMEDGTLPKLQRTWWKDKGVCAISSDSSGKRELSLSNVAGIFYILVGGLAVAVIIASIEFLCTKTKFLEKTSYIKATETVTTLLNNATMDRENGDIGNDHSNNTTNYSEKQESTFNYAAPPPCIGFEHFTQGQTEL
ncbi:glutamate receptor 3-like [Mercenaria mercenaria]|uniref:glutamate receptor 3-like n=1 Tax=Mercenaria mercenaria TaxID=6596 RepID=UPI00234E8FE7|nr:glutamate receptor 3-like [Mercenaria mercenaria]